MLEDFFARVPSFFQRRLPYRVASQAKLKAYGLAAKWRSTFGQILLDAR